MKVLDLFSGVGGFAEGMGREGFETVAFCEIEPYAKRVLKRNFPEVPIYDDVREITADRLTADGITGIQCVVGGFPCQPFSRIGERKGNEDDRSLWSEMRRIIEEVRPRWVIAENVVGLVEMELDSILSDLESLRYTTTTFDLPASSVGANHERRRIWIIGCDETDMAYPNSERLQGWESDSLTQRQSSEGYAGQGHRWMPTPRVCRRGDGVQNRMDRLKCLGNAVVPDIPQQLARVIKNVERAYSNQ